MLYTRRKLLAGFGLASLPVWIPSWIKKAETFLPKETSALEKGACPFRLAVINDEITQDFEKACQIVARDFGLHWIELRSMWNKNVTDLGGKEIEDARKLLSEHKLQVTDIASPLFKTDWPGAPPPPRAKRATSSMRMSTLRPRISFSNTVFLLPIPSRRKGFAVSIFGAWMIPSPIVRRSTPSSEKPPSVVPKTILYYCSKTKCPATRRLEKSRPPCSGRSPTEISC